MGRILRRFDTEKVVPAARVEAEREARAILDEAAQEAERVLASAARRRDEAEREALSLLASATLEAERLRTLTEAQLVSLARALCERVVARAHALDPSLVEDEAKRAIATLARARALRLRAHPDDYDRLVRALGDDPRLRIERDDTLARGDVVVLSDVGRVDARIETRLANVTSAFERKA